MRAEVDMKVLMAVIFFLIFVGGAGSARAYHAPVSVNGLAWLQPIDFINSSWNEIADVCDPITGLCTGSLGGNMLNGWTWASVEDLNALFNSFIGRDELGPSSPDSYFEVGSTWAPSFLGVFECTYCEIDGSESSFGVYGTIRDSFDAGRGYSAVMTDNSNASASAGDFTSTSGIYFKNGSVDTRGAWFFQEASSPPTDVSSPTTVPLLALGLLSLSLLRRSTDRLK
jgi:hypothetical protein